MKIKYTKEEIELVKALRPINDTLFRTMAKDNIPLVEHIIRVTLNRDDISILRVNTQDDIHIFEKGHSVILDCLGVDSNGVLFDIEVQKFNNDSLEKRVRYYSSMLDSRYSLSKGMPFKEIKDSYVIFLMEEDYFHLGGQVYEVEKVIKGYNLPFIDGSNTIFVNATNKGREDLDNLMQSLVSTDYREMKDQVIRECTMYYKTTVDGEDKVCEALREYVAKSYDTGKADGINIGITKGTVTTLINLVNSGNITLDYAIANSGLSKEEFSATAKELGLSC
ncbi:MAG: Rpn family recombination-promoting nuclease/putative transposase [Spirochaetales bacterium]|uniref:Rpn family recombination-promoting nuclease/putative transposase n=1 Tax=Bullifex sp. TaxID=2815808 RepID=UPI002A54E433|nr:Rpn family recombination-promoting nuclease/putative transposase [Bullifex sp.]MDD7271371.1 Rpn family recombination-promoting nuclease/putative transposase [Spirochaetales bacterium]MDY4067126.1 Rpn family recombination-promoting nuclease/putative transposase [Bullifex sp.]